MFHASSGLASPLAVTAANRATAAEEHAAASSAAGSAAAAGSGPCSAAPKDSVPESPVYQAWELLDQLEDAGRLLLPFHITRKAAITLELYEDLTRFVSRGGTFEGYAKQLGDARADQLLHVRQLYHQHAVLRAKKAAAAAAAEAAQGTIRQAFGLGSRASSQPAPPSFDSAELQKVTVIACRHACDAGVRACILSLSLARLRTYAWSSLVCTHHPHRSRHWCCALRAPSCASALWKYVASACPAAATRVQSTNGCA